MNQHISSIILQKTGASSLYKQARIQDLWSGYGEIIEDDRIEHLLVKLAKFLNLRGSINVQLRIHKEQPTVFEINPRFSSTVLFRHLFGFKDLLWSIEYLFNQNISSYPY